MTEQEFYNEIKNNITGYLPDEYSNKLTATLDTVLKNNDTMLHGLLIRMEGEDAGPVIYLDNFHKEYENGKPVETIMNKISDIYINVRSNTGRDATTSPKILMQYTDIRDKLFIQILDMRRNRKRLSTLHYTPIGNGFAMVYCILHRMDHEGISKIGITKEMVREHSYDIRALQKDALANSEKLFPASFLDMGSVIQHAMGGSERRYRFLNSEEEVKQDLMYVLTNIHGTYGAAALYYPGAQEKIGDLLGKDYFILPSSIHEVIIVPQGDGFRAEELEHIVKDVNETVVEPSDILSDRVLHYDRDEKKLTQVSMPAKEKGPQEMEVR